MTGLEIYLICAVLVLAGCIFSILWIAGGAGKEPTYRIREDYVVTGYYKERRTVYIVEIKGRFGRWVRLQGNVSSLDSAEYNLRAHIMDKIKQSQEKEIKYFDSLGNLK